MSAEASAAPPAPSTRRIAAAVEYSGRAFSGWQRQSHSPSVQEAVEAALSFVADESLRVHCAGRTDAGVHATNQIVHFETSVYRAPVNWIRGANSRLPAGVRVHWAAEVAPEFHARFSASARSYRYLIWNAPVAPAIFDGYMTWCRSALDEQIMDRAARGLLGENDFSSFRAAGCQSRSPWRCVNHISVARRGRLLVLEITANAFLHHMVRNIAGCLMAAGQGRRPPDWPGQLLALRDRTRGDITAPADGLYLVAVDYPSGYGIPAFPPGPALLEAVRFC